MTILLDKANPQVGEGVLRLACLARDKEFLIKCERGGPAPFLASLRFLAPLNLVGEK